VLISFTVEATTHPTTEHHIPYTKSGAEQKKTRHWHSDRRDNRRYWQQTGHWHDKVLCN